MSIDGSFNLHFELERFLARCPNLKSVPRLNSLVEKGDNVDEEEIVGAIAELFLNEKYTIPIMGCFRPIVRGIVDKAVELLRLVPVLELNDQDTRMEVDDDGDDGGGGDYVIEGYVRSGKGLKLHEIACLAFCRALDLAPFLLRSVLNYFRFSPPPFQRLLGAFSASHLIKQDGAQLLVAVRASLRLLLVDSQVFSELWDWSSILDLVEQSTDAVSGNNPDLIRVALDIKWCAIQIVSVTLKMSDRATLKFNMHAETALECFFRWESFCQDVSLEKLGWYLDMNAFEMEKYVDRDVEVNQELYMKSFDYRQSNISLLHPNDNVSVRKNRRQMTGNSNSVECPFFWTSAMKKSFEMVLMAVSQKWPVLLYGPTGAGKTALINKLAQVSGNRVLSIHMDEQIDSTTLIGSYVCTEQPGEFRWQPGSLTQAIMSGFWVVFEDIDKAPSDVQSIILPLLEGTNSFVTGHGEAISVAESFRLFATVSSLTNDTCHVSEGNSALGVLWRRVMIRLSTNEEFLHIINAWYPSLESITKHLVDTYEKIRSSHSYQQGTSQLINRFSLRDLLKWCKRIESLEFNFLGHSLSAHERKSIYQEAIDIFAASSAFYENRLLAMKEIAKIWGVPAIEAETLFTCHKPSIQEFQTGFQIGRVTLKLTRNVLDKPSKPFVDIRSSLFVLERIACSVKHNEPVLLVGETGTGKTTLVQNLASRLGQPLTVLNLSQQSDVADLLGGLKPTDPQFICIPLYNEFMELFPRTFSKTVNPAILGYLKKQRKDRNWIKLLEALQKGHQKVVDLTHCEVGVPGLGKRKRPLAEEVLQAWELFSEKLNLARRKIDASSCMAFSFVEGAFIKALKSGHWILLDEVNLAPPETLQRIMGVLEGENGSLCLTERGDVDYIERHSDFRLFACMNPATDAGKHDLPYSVRSRFTEYFVDETLNDEDLTLFISQFLDDNCPNRELVTKIVQFYKLAKQESDNRLQDGANQKPQFSLRSLYRALEYLKEAQRKFGFQKALYDGFCMFFLTLLDGPSAKLMNNMICSYLLGGTMPPSVPFDNYLIVAKCTKTNPSFDDYILTHSVKEHLRNLARAILIKRYPVLLQGPTSSGKTSLVHYLASITGHAFVRINNHEHTDLQEYLGSYITDATGKLVFQEGVLVKAVRSGCWIVLDELNLAPSDVLEALNRLLDDNRELFVPELQETIKAHPEFMLFATQNPPTFYGGRKILSRAFRNRFVEIHVDEIPDNELSTILEKRCKIPESYAKKMVDVMKDLQLHRQNSNIFAGKHGFITPRDLFRWANRFRELGGKSYEDLAKDGYFLLAERLRDENEKTVVREILEKFLRVQLIEANFYKQEHVDNSTTWSSCNGSGEPVEHGNVIWTRSMQRLFFLVERCYKMREPVLLVGETGGGKTTVCQLLSTALQRKLHILNCHQFTETSDFIGGFYPVRDRSVLTVEFKSIVERLMLSNVVLQYREVMLSSDIGEASLTLTKLNEIISSYRNGQTLLTDITEGDLDMLEQMKMELVQLHQKWQTIFTWHDGPLVKAMKDGDLFLVDEISLADDSVLERLNSVLEPERKLALAEKGGSFLENITAHPNFFLLATMNPGGDYGKKELSPALRNRLTEIWVPSVIDSSELQSIALSYVGKSLSYTVDPMLKFWKWFSQLHTSRTLTVRDLLAWVEFMNVTERSFESPNYAFLHGAFLVLLDGLSLGSGISNHDAGKLREECLLFLLRCLKEDNVRSEDMKLSKLETFGWGGIGKADYICASIVHSDQYFGISPFSISKGADDCKPEGFEFLAPTTCRNAMRVLRAMQLKKPVLLEGSPGVGKTSLIVALGKFSGHRVVRINLSEQTDIMDLLGSDLPVEEAEGLTFAWSDGILLQALKNGDWVLLDELNLAPQSVLEGLNAILDHRAEVFIPELGHTYKCPPSFRVFACQNPSCQGGGRKGLPKSFLNRFTKVYVDELVEDDYLYICSSLHPSIPRPLLSKLILFNKRLYADTMIARKYGQDGSPWEFNLRDVIRSCQIIEGTPGKSTEDSFLSVVYIQRMRTATDRQEVLKLYEEVFGVKPFINPFPRVQVNPQYLIVGNISVQRNLFQPPEISKSQLNILPGIRHSLEAVLHCVKNQWLCILVGPSASGKTSLIRLLAHLTGNVLHEVNLSSATDISELLGCFEQYNAFRSFRSAVSQVERYMNEYCSLSLECLSESIVLERKDLISKWFTFLSSIYGKPSSSSASADAESWKSGSLSSLDSLIQIIEQLKLGLEGLELHQLPVSWSSKDLDEVLKTVLILQENSKKQAFPAKFEWVTGLLIKAIECGEWLVLENANLCNPTVLDRINSLVEPSGSITINERGLVDGRPVIIHPNNKFRLFLTVNPRYGEVSRAMRNRGIEVFMMQPDWLQDNKNRYGCQETEVNDVKRFLVLAGIPLSVLIDTMANAHIFARNTGMNLGVQITLLELTRWVQLFQQLILNGNKPLWSLQVSWEHTYLSSLGEFEGRPAVEHAKDSFLSASTLSKLDVFLSYSSSLPGGWPTPQRLKKFVWHSKEACVLQNCMYLEFLGAQYASFVFSESHRGDVMLNHSSNNSVVNSLTSSLCTKMKQTPSLIPLKMVLPILFPTTSYQMNSGSTNTQKFDLALANRMLLFAANWAIEQATEGDFNLYLLCLSQYSSLWHPYCPFFKSYLDILKQELDHSIWKCIFDCRRELIAHYEINVDAKLLPVLSLDLLNLITPDDTFQSSKTRLFNSIKCVNVLHNSFQQWNAEDNHNCEEKIHFALVLESLRELEKEVLSKLVDSISFNLLHDIYSDLIAHHSLLWNAIISSKSECLLICWRSLKKDVLKLQKFFPKEVKSLLVYSNELLNIQAVKSMLWTYGGHPFLPSSVGTYNVLQQLLKFCQLVWPADAISWKHTSSAGNSIPVKAILSANTELRFLAMQGIGMSSFLSSKGDQEDATMVRQLEEMHQILLERFEFEKQQLEGATLFETDISACCVFRPEKFHKKFSFSSWQEMFCLFDSTSFYLDMELLKELSCASLTGEDELFKALDKNSEILKTSLSFSLEFSSRPPMDFIPHQIILWALDAWESVDSVNLKIASSIHEMWFKWHSFLWTCSETFTIDSCGSPLPYMLFQPTKSTVLAKILDSGCPVKEFDELRLKLTVASGNLWHDSPSKRELPDFLLTAARSLFEQIILAHKKSFEKEKYAEIKSTFLSVQGYSDKNEKLLSLDSLIASSSHKRLTSLVVPFIRPLLRELYLQKSSYGFLENLGCAWLNVGRLRFELLLTPDDLDPTIKYSIKHSQIVEEISLLELEIKVCQECENLVGRSSSNDVLKQRQQQLEKLEAERKRLQKKIVFRHDPSTFTRLKSECADFLGLTVSSSELTKNMATMSTSQMLNKAFNWQETAKSFINRLSDEYAAYTDIIQPVQVAVYEMKLGLSLVISSALQKTFLAKMEEDTTSEHILETICYFMQFPRGLAVPFNTESASNGGSDCLPSDKDVSGDVLALDINLLERLCTIPKDNISDKMASVPQLHAALYHNILVRVTHSVVNSLLLGYESFELLNKIFDKFAGLWMSMKIQTKAKEAEGARNYKFKTRQFKIEDILEVDVSTLGHSFSDGTLCEEWQEMTTEEESTEWVAPKENEDLEEEWGLIDESILNSMVHIHNQFFGSCSLADSPGFNQISDVDKLSSFRESYKLGWTMVKVLPALLSSSLDAKLVSEHLLHLSLDYEEKFENFHQPKCAYNVYKDSNPPVIAKMVDPLIDLQQRVLSLLNEWPDHPDLQKMLDVTKMILAIPFSTPLPKVLSGLQFLLTKSHELDENAPKLSLSDKMRPILTLVSTWQKLELESWPALLDGVQEQYEINSGKLWFPLYTVLYRGPTADMAADNQSTIQSLEEFIQTSSVGEFKRRLQLLLAFHGQMSICLKFNKCPSLTQNNENLDQQMKYIGNIEKILYNLFGYYIQFMPLVSEHIAAIKRSISADIKELMKLHRWERPDNYLSIEISKRTRQKLKKHIQKFNDVLQQPMMVILSKEIAKVGITVESVLKQEVSTDNLYKCSLSSPISIDMKLFTGTERSIWHTDWRKKVDFSLEYWSHLKLSDFNLQYISLKDAEENDSFIKQSLISQSGCWEEWKPLWNSLENVCRTITECDDIWDVEKKNFGKRRALSDLLKLLESCGLSRRKSMIAEEGFGTNHQNSWFLQPSYHVKHLLPPNGDDVTSYNQIEFPLGKRFDSTWKTANQYHYGSLAMVQLLRQTCLNFHKDISLDQVTKAASFVDHLIVIQQEQRSFAYKFTGDVENLRNCVNSLNDLDMNYSINGDATTIESFVALKQHATRTSMWSQKTLLDNLYCISQETTLFLRKVESTHLNSCQSVKVAANKLLAFFGKFIPTLRKSKDSLDQYLLKGSRSLATPEAFSSPFLVSKQMEQLVIQNFQEINELEEHVQAFSQQDVTKRSVEESLVQRLGDVLHKGKVRMQETCYAVEPKNHAINSSDANASSNSSSDPEAEFANSFSRTLDLIIKTFQKLGSSTSELDHSEDTLTAKITQWKVLVQSDQMNLQLDLICQELSQTITTAGQLIDCAGDRIPNLCYEIQLYLNYLCALVHPILAMADGFLLEFLTIHRTVAEMTYILAKVFASLFSKGFGGSSEDPTDDTNGDASQAASGTGMGEGAGVKDVSDQIEDEDQLLGTSEKPTDELETPNEPPSKNEKGVEMDQDFAADTFSVSEDSGEEDNDDNEDNEDQKLDSAMGNTGDDNEVVDEKLWDKDDEGNPDTKNEKNESGPSVKDMDNNSRELQAKGDDDNTLDESAEPNADKPDKDNPNDDDQDGDDHDESLDDVKLDKESAVTDPTGIEMDDQNQAPEEDTNMEEAEVSDAMEPEGTDAMEEVETEDLDETDKNENDGDGMTDELDEETEKVKSGEVDGNAETDDPEKDHDEAAADLDLLSPTKNEIEQGDTNFAGNTVPLANSGMQLNAEAPTTEMSAMEPMEHRSSNENMQNGLAPSMGLPSGNSVDAKLTMPDSIKGGELTADEQKAQSPQLDNSSVERTQPNPYRSVGDALEKWKERVKVSTDAEEHKAEVPDEVDDDNADEYGFVPELEKGTSQALGPATSDQIDRNIKGSDADGEEGLTEKKEDLTEMEVQKQEPEIFTSKNHSALMQKLNEQMHNSDLNTETPPDEALEEGFDEDDSSIMSRDIVTLKKSYMEEEILQFARLAVDEEDLGKAMNLEMSTVVEGDPAALWRKYEQITARLSQELAEQLRLVMEPTLASKLQGDYKTGKRINMKKVIAYIASYYRKDKIWLRRTRPNKRDYQVVVAVDDSRSMSESHCEGVAIEALVTVCRAMSQLEVGKLAVASFGKKGNIRLLHDFDQQFTGEAGMKMISSLTFKQENTILDEPVVDLLQYLNNLLDVAAATSRLPSGQSPLQQLVLIIGDGRFHEKERLKRRVRDLLNKNRMVAFLLLDSPQDSIIKCQEVSMQGGQPILSRYLDSFPFPYYIVLKNIEALPRTLADLLRQWFELMQNTRD